MSYLNVICEILKGFEEQSHNDKFDERFLEKIDMSKTEKEKLLLMMLDENLIDGIEPIYSTAGTGLKYVEPKITIEGLTYLQKNK